MRSVLISGEPALWSAGANSSSVAREEQWKSRIRDALQDSSVPPRTILLHFAVQGWTRRGHHFDLDNLVTPVFRALYGNSNRDRIDARAALVSWRAIIGQSPTPFLLLDFLESESLDQENILGGLIIDSTWTGALPANSRDGDHGLAKWVREQMGGFCPASTDRFGVRLIFGATTRDISRPEEKPIKSVIDCLYPIFGGAAARGEDWNKILLQIERRVELQGSCHIQCWRKCLDENVRDTKI